MHKIKQKKPLNYPLITLIYIYSHCEANTHFALKYVKLWGDFYNIELITLIYSRCEALKLYVKPYGDFH